MKQGPEGNGGRESRLLRALVRLYPRAFRERFGDDVLRTLGAAHRAASASGVRGRAAFWLRNVADLIVGAVRERIAVRRPRDDVAAAVGSPQTAARWWQAAAASRWAWRIDALASSIRLSGRRFKREPLFAAGVVLTFALGIGANASIFAILDRILLSPPSYVQNADQIVRLITEFEHPFFGAGPKEILGYQDFLDISGVGGIESAVVILRQSLTFGRGADAVRANADLVSGSFFSLLGVQPVAGRFITPADDEPGSPPVAVIGYGEWQRVHGGDPGVIGETVDFGHGPYTIVGVAPRGFTGIDLRPVGYWLPFQVAHPQLLPSEVPGGGCMEIRECYVLKGVARLNPGVSVESVEAEATAALLNGREEASGSGEGRYPGGLHFDPGARVIFAPLIAARGPLASRESKIAVWLAGISILVLLIACANIANLIASRSIRQQSETAVRLALGSSRARVVLSVLTETLLLALVGGAVAVLVAQFAAPALWQMLLPEVDWNVPGSVVRVAVLALGLAVGSGILATLPALLHASRPNLRLRNVRGESSSPSRTRNVLIALQAAICLLLLLGAAAFTRSLRQASALDLGLDPDGVLDVAMQFEPETTNEWRRNTVRMAADRIASLPGVEDVAVDISHPFGGMAAFTARRSPTDSVPGGPTTIAHQVNDSYFEVLDLDVLRGRRFTSSDAGTRVALIEESMAQQYWPGDDPIGECLYVLRIESDTPCHQIIGLVEDARRGYADDELLNYYLPVDLNDPEMRVPDVFLVRVVGDPNLVVAASVRRELLSLDPRLRSVAVAPLREGLSSQTRPWRLGATLFGLFGGLALVVAAVGLYSVLAYSVAQRTFELGIRSAIGASSRRIIASVVGQGLVMVGMGATVGLIIAVAISPRLEGLLFQVSPRDPATIAVVVLVLCAAALLACIAPALRATRIDPATALRSQ